MEIFFHSVSAYLIFEQYCGFIQFDTTVSVRLELLWLLQLAIVRFSLQLAFNRHVRKGFNGKQWDERKKRKRKAAFTEIRRIAHLPILN